MTDLWSKYYPSDIDFILKYNNSKINDGLNSYLVCYAFFCNINGFAFISTYGIQNKRQLIRNCCFSNISGYAIWIYGGSFVGKNNFCEKSEMFIDSDVYNSNTSINCCFESCATQTRNRVSLWHGECKLYNFNFSSNNGGHDSIYITGPSNISTNMINIVNDNRTSNIFWPEMKESFHQYINIINTTTPKSGVYKSVCYLQYSMATFSNLIMINNDCQYLFYLLSAQIFISNFTAINNSETYKTNLEKYNAVTSTEYSWSEYSFDSNSCEYPIIIIKQKVKYKKVTKYIYNCVANRYQSHIFIYTAVLSNQQ